MPTTFNLLDRKNGLYPVDVSGVPLSVASTQNFDWTSTNCTIDLVSDNFLTTNRLVMKVSGITYSTVSMSLVNYPLSITDNGQKISFNCKIKCLNSIIVSISTYIHNNQNTLKTKVTNIQSGSYSAAHSEIVEIPAGNTAHTITIIISIAGHELADIFVTYPNLIFDEDFHQNPFIKMMRNFFPDFYFDIDGQQTGPTYPFFKLLDALSYAAGDSNLMSTKLSGFDNEEILDPNLQTDFWARSVLTTPELAGSEYGPWLAQFTGESLKKNIQLQDSSFYFDNEAKIHEFMAWQLSRSYFGRASGTKAALVDSVKQILQKTKNGNQSTRSVVITTKYEGNPFKIRIQTLENETPDASNGQPSYLVLAAAEFARPMGFLLSHNTLTVFYFTLDDESLGVIGAFAVQ